MVVASCAYGVVDMVQSMRVKSGATTQPLRILVRTWDWAAWCRELIRGVQAYAHGQKHWRLFVDAAHTGVRKYIDAKIPWDGIISGALHETAGWRELVRRGRTRVVAVTASVPPSLQSLPAVRVDERKVGEFILRHLLAGGFRHIAYYGIISKDSADTRGKLLQECCAKRDIPIIGRPKMRRSADPYYLPSVTRWVAQLPKPIGIVSWNMDAARRIVEACQRAGIAVPEQAAVVSWDDDVLVAETAEPTVTGVVHPAERLGYEAARLLDKLLHGEPAPAEPVLVEPSGLIHVRQSSDVLDLPDREVHLALQFMREHVTEPLTIDHVARSLGISRRRFEQDFVRVTGSTPYATIISLRLERAKLLLVESNFTVDQIAEMLGFGSKHSLYRAFARHDGSTPTEYRRRYRSGGGVL